MKQGNCPIDGDFLSLPVAAIEGCIIQATLVVGGDRRVSIGLMTQRGIRVPELARDIFCPPFVILDRCVDQLIASAQAGSNSRLAVGAVLEGYGSRASCHVGKIPVAPVVGCIPQGGVAGVISDGRVAVRADAQRCVIAGVFLDRGDGPVFPVITGELQPLVSITVVSPIGDDRGAVREMPQGGLVGIFPVRAVINSTHDPFRAIVEGIAQGVAGSISNGRMAIWLVIHGQIIPPGNCESVHDGNFPVLRCLGSA